MKAVIAKGQVDAAKVGVVGHSWGGFDASFLATHTDVFAAAVAGAPITNLVSNYGNFHWNIGIAETDHIETGQQRMEVPIYEDLQAYIRNSAVYGVGTMRTPLLMLKIAVAAPMPRPSVRTATAVKPGARLSIRSA